MSIKREQVLGVIYWGEKHVHLLWNPPPEYRELADKELGEKLGEVIMQTIRAYIKEKGIEGGVAESPKTKDYVA